MPESRKRKTKRNRIRQRIAAHDGERFRVAGCCPDLEVELGVGRMKLIHNDDCVALNPFSPDFITARTQANMAGARAMAERGIGPAVTIMVP